MLRLYARQMFEPEVQTHFAVHDSMRLLAGTPHDHDYYELFYIARGGITHRINGTDLPLSAGDLVFIRPFDTHTFLDGEGCRLLNLAFSTQVLEELLRYLGQDESGNAALSGPMPPQAVVPPVERDMLERRLYALTAIAPAQTKSLRLNSRLLVADVLTRYILDDDDQTVERNSKPSSPFERLLAEMAEPEQFTQGIERLKRLSPYSYEHLCRLFRSTLGVTPTDWINERKLIYAANLLVHTDYPVVEIAAQAGFEHLGYFYRLFKKRFGTPPFRYRSMRQTPVIP